MINLHNLLRVQNNKMFKERGGMAFHLLAFIKFLIELKSKCLLSQPLTLCHLLCSTVWSWFVTEKKGRFLTSRTSLLYVYEENWRATRSLWCNLCKGPISVLYNKVMRLCQQTHSNKSVNGNSSLHTQGAHIHLHMKRILIWALLCSHTIPYHIIPYHMQVGVFKDIYMAHVFFILITLTMSLLNIFTITFSLCMFCCYADAQVLYLHHIGSEGVAGLPEFMGSWCRWQNHPPVWQ